MSARYERHLELASTNGVEAVVRVYNLGFSPVGSIAFVRDWASMRQAMSRDDLVLLRDAINEVLAASVSSSKPKPELCGIHVGETDEPCELPIDHDGLCLSASSSKDEEGGFGEGEHLLKLSLDADRVVSELICVGRCLPPDDGPSNESCWLRTWADNEDLADHVEDLHHLGVWRISAIFDGDCPTITLHEQRSVAPSVSQQETGEREVTELRAALKDAIDLAEEGWGYASAYFRAKYDIVTTIADLRAILSAVPSQQEDDAHA
jgi:hypothetical protein